MTSFSASCHSNTKLPKLILKAKKKQNKTDTSFQKVCVTGFWMFKRLLLLQKRSSRIESKARGQFCLKRKVHVWRCVWTLSCFAAVTNQRYISSSQMSRCATLFSSLEIQSNKRTPKNNPARLLSVLPLCLPSSLPLPLIHHWQNLGDGCSITSLTDFLVSLANKGWDKRDTLALFL